MMRQELYIVTFFLALTSVQAQYAEIVNDDGNLVLMPLVNGSVLSTGDIYIKGEKALTNAEMQLQFDEIETRIMAASLALEACACGLCSSSPCQNGGSCSSTSAVGGFHCDCPDSWTGSSCESALVPGDYIWTLQLTSDPANGQSLSPNAMDLDMNGAVFVAYRESWAVPAITKISKNGAVEWKREYNMTDSGVTTFTGIAVADDGKHAYVCGQTSGSFIPANTSNAGLNDAVVMKVTTSDGTIVWARQLGSVGPNTASSSNPRTSSEDDVDGIAVNAAEEVFVVGASRGVMPLSSSHQGYRDLFILKFDSNGTHEWTMQRGNSGGHERLNAVVTDSTGVYVAGYADLGLDGEPHVGGYDVLLMKYTTAKTRLFTQMEAGINSYMNRGVSTSDNYVTCAGFTERNPTTNLFATQYDKTTGAFRWRTETIGSAGSRLHSGVSYGDDTSIAFGYTEGTILNHAYLGGSTDAVLVYYDAAGSITSSRLIGTNESDAGQAVAKFGSTLLVAGTTGGNLFRTRQSTVSEIFIAKILL